MRERETPIAAGNEAFPPAGWLIPDGFALVPVEPTEEMLRAGHQQIDWCRDQQHTDTYDDVSQKTDGVGTNCREDMIDAWRAMLAAAAKAGAGR